MKPLHKTTIVIWSDPESISAHAMEVDDLAREAMEGLAYCTRQDTDLIDDPLSDPEFAGGDSFFGDDDEDDYLNYTVHDAPDAPVQDDEPVLRNAIIEVNERACVDCGHGPGEHAATGEAPCEIPGCPCVTLHYLCDCTPKAWPRRDFCSECGRAVKLVHDLTDPVYVHTIPLLPDEPERCNHGDDTLVASTLLRDLEALIGQP